MIPSQSSASSQLILGSVLSQSNTNFSNYRPKRKLFKLSYLSAILLYLLIAITAAPTTQAQLISTPSDKTESEITTDMDDLLLEREADPEEDRRTIEPPTTQYKTKTDIIQLNKQVHETAYPINILWVVDKKSRSNNIEYTQKMMEHIIDITSPEQTPFNIKLSLSILSSSQKLPFVDSIERRFQIKHQSNRLKINSYQHGEVQSFNTLGGFAYFFTKGVSNNGFKKVFGHAIASKSTKQRNIIVFVTQENSKKYPPPPRSFFSLFFFVVAGAFTGGAAWGALAAIGLGGAGFALDRMISDGTMRDLNRTYEKLIGSSKYETKVKHDMVLKTLKVLFQQTPFEVWSVVGGAEAISYNASPRFSWDYRGEEWELDIPKPQEEANRGKLKKKNSSNPQNPQYTRNTYNLTFNSQNRMYHEKRRCENCNALQKYIFNVTERTITPRTGGDSQDIADARRDIANLACNETPRQTPSPSSFGPCTTLCEINYEEESIKKAYNFKHPSPSRLRIDGTNSFNQLNESYQNAHLEISMNRETKRYEITELDFFNVSNNNNLQTPQPIIGRKFVRADRIFSYPGLNRICRQNSPPTRSGNNRVFDYLFNQKIHPTPLCVSLCPDSSWKGSKGRCQVRTGLEYIMLAQRTAGLTMTPCASRTVSGRKLIKKKLFNEKDDSTNVTMFRHVISQITIDSDDGQHVHDIKKVSFRDENGAVINTYDDTEKFVQFWNKELDSLREDPNYRDHFVKHQGSQTLLHLYLNPEDDLRLESDEYLDDPQQRTKVIKRNNEKKEIRQIWETEFKNLQDALTTDATTPKSSMEIKYRVQIEK